MLDELVIVILIAVIIVVLLFAYGVLSIIHPRSAKEKAKKKEEKPKPKPKPEAKSPSKPVPPNPCFYADQGGYVGILRKEWKKDREYPPKCYEPTEKNPNGCPHLFECIGVKK